MHHSLIFKSLIFKGFATAALLLFLVVPALPAAAEDGHVMEPGHVIDEGNVIPEGDMSQSKATIGEIEYTTAVTAAYSTLDAILARSAALFGFDGNATAAETGTTGASGGNGPVGAGVWVNGGLQRMDRSGLQWSRGNMSTLTAGLDKKIASGKAVVGLSLGGEWLRLDMSDNGKYKSDGFSLTPYFSYALQPTLMLDASLGLGWQSNHQRSSYISAVDLQRHEMQEDFDSWRLFTAAGLSKFWMVNKWLISARFGAMYLHQNTGSYTMRGSGGLPFSNDIFNVSKNLYDVFQLSLGGRVSYQYGNLRPFVAATYVQDVAKSGEKRDYVGLNFAAGFNYRINNVSLGLTGTYGMRSGYKNYGGLFNIRLDF